MLYKNSLVLRTRAETILLGEAGMKPKLVVTGLAGHGKDTVCEILRDIHGFTFESSSRILLNEVIFPVLQAKYDYNNADECYNDRTSHRQDWFELLKEYNKDDKSKLGKLIFSNYDIYCGLRNIEELEAMKASNMFSYVIWVDASARLGITESSNSITITKNNADYILPNNLNLNMLELEINWMIDWVQKNLQTKILRSELQSDKELYNDLPK